MNVVGTVSLKQNTRKLGNAWHAERNMKLGEGTSDGDKQERGPTGSLDADCLQN